MNRIKEVLEQINEYTTKEQLRTTLNKYNINFLNNAGIITGFKAENPLRVLITSFTEFVIDNNSTSFPVLGFTGSTSILNDVLKFEVKGNPFISGTSFVEKFHMVEIRNDGLNVNLVLKELLFKSQISDTY